MRRILGVGLLFVVGCATQPNLRRAEEPNLGEALPVPPGRTRSARVGIEFLPPETTPFAAPTIGLSAALLGVRDEAVPGTDVRVSPVHVAQPVKAVAPGDEPPRRKLASHKDEFSNERSAMQKFTLDFMSETAGEDGRRMQRDLGAAIISRATNQDSFEHLPTPMDEKDQQDQALWINRRGAHLLRRPLRRAFRKSSTFGGIGSVFENVRPEHFPVSPSHPHRSNDTGRFSVRVHTKIADPLELVYKRSGFRFGGSRRHFKASYTARLATRMSVTVGSELGYDTGSLEEIFASLRFEPTISTRLNLLMSDHMDLLGGSDLLPVVQSPLDLRSIDDSPGLMFYVEHIF